MRPDLDLTLGPKFRQIWSPSLVGNRCRNPGCAYQLFANLDKQRLGHPIPEYSISESHNTRTVGQIRGSLIFRLRRLRMRLYCLKSILV